jgi:hypothetical protein
VIVYLHAGGIRNIKGLDAGTPMVRI